MTVNVTNGELGLPDDVSPAERDAAIKQAAAELHPHLQPRGVCYVNLDLHTGRRVAARFCRTSDSSQSS